MKRRILTTIGTSLTVVLLFAASALPANATIEPQPGSDAPSEAPVATIPMT
jgi:hypothetical protein